MNQTSENQNGGNTVVGAIKFIAGLSFFVGLVSLISGINSEYQGWILISIGLACMMNCPIICGFAYLVEAACKYLGKDKVLQIQEVQQPAPKKSVPSGRLTDDERIANLKELVETGALSQEEFEEEVKRIKSK
ncbi:MAG: SHOCT domain-containing protein [Prevotella sp.]|nr:SHOCT domain-containing protein [Prevotella sp.]